jgi:uncharacterized protein
MDVVELKKVIQSQEREKEAILSSGVVPRDVDAECLRKSLSRPNALAILGMRRCGKSVLSWLLLEGKKYAYINFDDESLYGMSAKDLDLAVRAFYELYGDVEYMIFDEIQNVPGWELFINRMRRTKKVIITGSNSQMLSGELASRLTGRHVDTVIYPFSFREFCRLKGVEPATDYTTETAARMQAALDEYMEKGGLPEAHSIGAHILKPVFGDIVKKDVEGRHRLKPGVAEALAKYLATNSSCETSFSRLSKIFSVKKPQTMRSYLRYFEETYLFFILERFSYKLKEQAKAPKKVYCADTGIANAVSFKFSADFGRMYETAVASELKRRGAEFYYWKSHQNEEVDFVVKDGYNVSQLIQVCYDPSSQPASGRELRALAKAGKELRCKDLLVITRNIEKESGEVHFVPLWKWLLEG